MMIKQENWLPRESVKQLIILYYTRPNYSFRGIGDEVGCNRNTVRRYVKKFETGVTIPQLSEYDLLELTKIREYAEHNLGE